ncbi:MAG TPA: cupin domain-containing protein [Candidatus Limnocylindria bacterium]|nr:cupin domain-containing protein [Candidatus Limnocylindria bacterium]
MKRAAILAIVGALGIVVAVTSAGVAQATPPSGVGAPFTARATLGGYHFQSNDFKIFQKDREDIVMRELTIASGGNGGWHSHPGPSYVIVTEGTLSLYHGDDPTCTAHTFGPGEGFVEAPGEVHIPRNEGTTVVTLLVVFLDVPVGGAFRIDAPSPGNCSF